MASTEAELLIAQGQALEDAGELAAARTLFDDAIAVAPDYPRGHLNLGNVLRKLDEFDAAVQAFRTSITLAPDYGAARYNLSSLLVSQGEYAAAEVEIRQALRSTPELAEASVLLADILESTGRTQRQKSSFWAPFVFAPILRRRAQSWSLVVTR